MHFCGLPPVTARLGVELAFVAGAALACYWEGPAVRASLASTTFRLEAILAGGSLMLLTLVLKLARQFN